MIASTSTWLKGSSYCLELVQDHSVGVPAIAPRSWPGNSFAIGPATAAAAAVNRKLRLDITSDMHESPARKG